MSEADEKAELEHAIAQAKEAEGKKVPPELKELADERRLTCKNCSDLCRTLRSPNPTELGVTCGPGGKGCSGYALTSLTVKCRRWRR